MSAIWRSCIVFLLVFTFTLSIGELCALPQGPFDDLEREESAPQDLAPITQGGTTVPESCRSVIDPEHPFYILRIGEAPSDANARIYGQSLTVYEMLRPIQSPQARRKLLHAYWELSGAIAQYKLANFKKTQYTDWIADLSGNADAAFVKVFQSAETLAEAKTRTLELRAIQKQHALALLLQQHGVYQPVIHAANRPSNEMPLPIPADLPLVGGYNTQANQMVRYRNAPSRIMQLDREIALQKEILDAKFREFDAASQYCDAVRESGPRAEGIIDSYNQQIATQAEALDEIVKYNQLIADYVAETIGPEVTGQRLIRILLRTPQPNSQPNSQPNTQPNVQQPPPPEPMNMESEEESFDNPYGGTDFDGI